MKTPAEDKKDQDKLDQLGGTDQIEQLAADIVVEEKRSRVTDADRQRALDQMNETKVSPQEEQDNQTERDGEP